MSTLRPRLARLPIVNAETSTSRGLLRWDAAGFAQRELADRLSAHLPPASRLTTITGSSDAVTGVLGSITLPDAAEVLGPVPVEERAGPQAAADQQPPVRAVVRVPRARGAELSRALVEMQGVRDGFVKLFCRPGTGIVVGGVVVGPRASELIHPVSIAVAESLTADQLAQAFTVYPSMSGSVAEAARRLHHV